MIPSLGYRQSGDFLFLRPLKLKKLGVGGFTESNRVALQT
jgi:hypothetical protein